MREQEREGLNESVNFYSNLSKQKNRQEIEDFTKRLEQYNKLKEKGLHHATGGVSEEYVPTAHME